MLNCLHDKILFSIKDCEKVNSIHILLFSSKKEQLSFRLNRTMLNNISLLNLSIVFFKL